MADVVQYRLERMVEELEDLEQRGLFTHQEIAEIVKQRRKFEYRLKRPSPLKQDYLAYIEYETQLDALRRLRKEAVARELKKQGNVKITKSKMDVAGVMRIIELYERAVTRYKGDIDLWFRYIEYCRQKKNGRMKRALAKLVRFHPKVPGVWIYAAAWEFDHNGNTESARALMLNGIRECNASEDLWVEYLRMELTFLNKIKARKIALGEVPKNLTNNDEKEWRDENQDLFMSLKGNEETGGLAMGSEVSKTKLDQLQELDLKAFQSIYLGALEALPSSFNLRKRFLEILEASNLANGKQLQNDILSDMRRDFATEPHYWDWLAKFECNPENLQYVSEELMLTQVQKAVQVYEDALKNVPSSTMYHLYAKFLKDIIYLKTEKGHNFDSCHYEINHLLKIYESAEGTGCITEDLACQHISFYLQLGQLNEAKKLAEKLCRGRLESSVEFWTLRISVEIKSVTQCLSYTNKDYLQPIFELLRYILPKVPISKSQGLWKMALKFFACQRQFFDKLVEIAITSLVKFGGSEDGFSLSSTIVNFVLEKDGIQHARETYKRFLALPHPGLALFRNCIDLESNLASVGDKCGLLNARKLYESALATYNQNVNLWQAYYRLEATMGKSETANAVCWRARKTLKDASTFIVATD